MNSIWPQLEPLLAKVQKPARYIGCEDGSQSPDHHPDQASWLLIYPDTYEIGLPNQGLQILYEIINERPGAVAERSYAPWVDLEAEMRAAGVPLFSVDTHRPAVGGPDRHPGQVDAVEQVGVDELGRQVEGQQVEGPGRAVRVDREQRQLMRPEHALHVGPRGVGALGRRVGPLVEDLVEDLQALVGQPDLVGVGVDQQPGRLVGAVVGGLAAVLAPDVAGRLLDPGQQGFELWPDRVHPREGYRIPRVGQTCRPMAYRNRCMWTLSTRPMATKQASVEEPP